MDTDRLQPALAASDQPVQDRGQLKLLAPALEYSLLVFMQNVLSVLTLGVYSFWGKTECRRYLWSRSELWGEPLEYTGSGPELFFGFLRALPIFVLIAAASGAIELLTPATQPLAVAVFYIMLMYLGAYGAYTGRRYRLSRTTWRGIRGGLGGEAADYAVLVMSSMLLNVLTLGLYLPYGQVAMHAYVMRHTELGNTSAEFCGDGKDLFGSWLLAWLLLIPTGSMSFWWYSAKSQNYLWSRTQIGDVRFEPNLRMGGLLSTAIMAVLLTVGTLGFGAPAALIMRLRYFYDHLVIVGRLDEQRLLQNQRPRPESGEGLLGLLDVDAA